MDQFANQIFGKTGAKPSSKQNTRQWYFVALAGALSCLSLPDDLFVDLFLVTLVCTIIAQHKKICAKLGFGFGRKCASTSQPRGDFGAGAHRDTADKTVSTEQAGGFVNFALSKRKSLENYHGRVYRITPTVRPLAAPTLGAVEFDAQVDEFVRTILPSARHIEVMKGLEAISRERIVELFPGAAVTGFVNSDFNSTAFAVAGPEIDMVITASLETLFQCLTSSHRSKLIQCLTSSRRSKFMADARYGSMISDIHRLLPAQYEMKLQTLGLRAIVDCLVLAGGFKFRRSHCRACQAILMAPASLGIHESPVPLSFVVNATVPFQNANLVTRAQREHSQVAGFLALVRRWAKVRGISHGVHRSLSPYAWNILAIYFLQIRSTSFLPLFPVMSLPKIDAAVLNTENWREEFDWASMETPDDHRGSMFCMGVLFKEFLKYYTDIDWSRERISVRTGDRSPPKASFPIHVVFDHKSSRTVATPCIEDPYASEETNLSSCMTDDSFARFCEELRRAATICSKDGIFGDVVQFWHPAECTAKKEGSDTDD